MSICEVVFETARWCGYRKPSKSGPGIYLIGPPNVRSVRPPAERQMKRVGGGKTEAAARES